MANISRRIRTFRLQRGLTQQAFAEIAGVEPKTVQRWEAGKSIPRFYSIQRLCTHFGMTPEELGVSDLQELEEEIGTQAVSASFCCCCCCHRCYLQK